MRLRLSAKSLAPLQTALARADRREIGGQLFGEQLAVADFRVLEIAIQHRAGSIARFFVDLVQAGRDALRFHDRTAHRYEQFNYLGEWHSHPSYAVQPSRIDSDTMRALVTDPEFKGNFAVLMITRLDPTQLQMGAWVFDRAGERTNVTLEIEA